MFYSKKGAKMLASAMAVAFAMSGVMFTPANTKAAADQAPTVKVLGATLRLDGESGKQSLRLGIEVDNASNAEACGMTITANERTVTIGTEEGSTVVNKTVYSVDKGADKIVYTAVITGIPKDNYADAFDIKGYVKESADAEEKAETNTVKRSVNKVVEALQKTNPNIMIDTETGNLVKVVTAEDGTETKEPVSEADFAGDINTIPEPEPELPDMIEVDLSKASVPGYGNKKANIETLDDGSVRLSWDSDADNYTGVTFKLDDAMDLTGYTCVIDAEGSNMNVNIEDAVRKNQYNNPLDLNNNGTKYGKSFPYSIKLNDNSLSDAELDYKCVGSVTIYKGDKAEAYELVIKSIRFYKNGYKPEADDSNELKLDITKIKGNKNVTVTNNEDGSVTLSWKEGAEAWSSAELIFAIPMNLSDYSKFIVRTKGGESIFCTHILDADKKNQYNGLASMGIRYGFPTNQEIALKDLLNSDYNGDLEGGNDADYTNVKGVSFQKNDQRTAVSFTITGISFIK